MTAGPGTIQIDDATDAAKRPGAAIGARRHSRWLHVVIALILLGAGLRLAQYLSHRSYWHDEAFLVLNLYDKSAAELLGPLDHDQVAPPLFLLIERAAVVWLGETEWATRLFPLLCGLLALPLFARLSWRTIPPPAAALAVALFVLSDRLIWHSAEAKPYSVDVLVALLLMWSAIGTPDETLLRRLLRTSLLASLLIWLSYTAVFVFAGIGLTFLIGALQHRRQFALLLLACLPVVVGFVLLNVTTLREQQDAALTAYWGDEIADYERWWMIPLWVIRKTFRLADYPYQFGAVLLPLVVVGVVWMWRHARRPLLGIIILPIVMTLLAAVLRRYPFDGSRVTLFLAPAVFLLAAAGWAAIQPAALSRFGRKVWVLPALLVALGAGPAVYHLVAPRTRAHLRPVIAEMRESFRPGDVIVADPDKVAEVLVYWRGDVPPADIVTEIPQPTPHRFWIVNSFGPRHFDDAVEPWLEAGEAVSDLRLTIRNEAAIAALYVTLGLHDTSAASDH